MENKVSKAKVMMELRAAGIKTDDIVLVTPQELKTRQVEQLERKLANTQLMGHNGSVRRKYNASKRCNNILDVAALAISKCNKEEVNRITDNASFQLNKLFGIVETREQYDAYKGK